MCSMLLVAAPEAQVGALITPTHRQPQVSSHSYALFPPTAQTSTLPPLG